MGKNLQCQQNVCTDSSNEHFLNPVPRALAASMLFYVVHYHNNLMKAHHYHKSHQIPNDSLEKMNIIILMFK